MPYFYEKRYYRRHDSQVYAKRYSRSFEYGQDPESDQSELGDDLDQLSLGDYAESLKRPSNAIEASISRARSNVRILAFSNPQLNGLLTLTFADIPSEEVAARRFKVFQKKVSRHYQGWQFLGVKELQKRGSIHYHLLVNFCPEQVHKPLSNRPLQQQSALWTYGISDFRPIKGDENFQTQLYLLKYLTKGAAKLFKQYYVRSRKLNKPIVWHIQERRPFPMNAENIFTTLISNNYVDSFEVTEYTYDRLKT